MADDEDEELCPLCMENLDITDQAATLCPCGYSMCLWCWHRIMEDAAKDSHPGRCPNCREPYDKERITNATVDPDKIATEKQKKKEEKKKTKVIVDKKALANVRVIQRNLVYVVGLSMSLCREEALRKQDYFGQYGKIVKISVNCNSPYSNMGIKVGPTGSAYVTYVRPQDALRCIENVDGATWDGRSIRACFGTTKYCNSYLKGLQCTNPDCLYLHEITSEENDCFTKEQMLARYGNAKNSPFFDLTHPTGVPKGPEMGRHHNELYGMDVHESEMQEQHMRSHPQNIPPGPHMGPGGNFPIRPMPPQAGSGFGLGGGGPLAPPGFGPGGGFPMGPGGSSSMMGPGPADRGMMGPSGMMMVPPRGPSPVHGAAASPSGAGGGMSPPPGGFQEGPSWGQVAASGKVPPPPPPQPAAAVEEWPVLGGPPVSRTSSGIAPGGSISRTGSGKVKGAPAAAAAAIEAQQVNGKGGVELIDSLGGIMVGKPPVGRGKAAPGSSQVGAPGMNSPGGSGPSSPFLSAAGSQVPPPQPKPVSGMVTMSIPKPQGAVSSSLRPASGPQKPAPSSSKSKGPPPGFGPPGMPGAGSGPLSHGAATPPSRGPPPGFEARSPSSNPGSAYSSMGNGGGNKGTGGSLDNDQLSALVDSLKAGLEPQGQDRGSPPPGVGEPLIGGLQDLELSSDSSNGRSMQQPGAGAIPNYLPAGLDVWSAEVPPAFAGLATAGYNPMGYNASAADPSARLLLRNPPVGYVGAAPAAPQQGAQAASAAQAPGELNGGDGGGRRARSRFQFARAEQDPAVATADPLWEGASGKTVPGAADVLQIFQQGSGSALRGAPPGFGAPQRPSGIGGVPPGMALLQRLQMGGAADMAYSMGSGAAQPSFLDPAIIASRTAPGMQPQGGASVRAPPPGFGGPPSGTPPGFGKQQQPQQQQSEAVQQPQPSHQLDTTEYSSWEAR